jgi:hypothetical protein
MSSPVLGHAVDTVSRYGGRTIVRMRRPVFVVLAAAIGAAPTTLARADEPSDETTTDASGDASGDAMQTKRFEVGAHLGLSSDHWGAADQSTSTGVFGLDARYAVLSMLAIGITGEVTFLPGTSGANLQYGLVAAWLRLPTGKIRPYAYAGMGVVHGSLETSMALGAGAGVDWCFGRAREGADCGLSVGPYAAATIALKDADLTLITYGGRVGTAF